jgi:hypothetical protein
VVRSYDDSNIEDILTFNQELLDALLLTQDGDSSAVQHVFIEKVRPQ